MNFDCIRLYGVAMWHYKSYNRLYAHISDIAFKRLLDRTVRFNFRSLSVFEFLLYFIVSCKLSGLLILLVL